MQNFNSTYLINERGWNERFTIDIISRSYVDVEVSNSVPISNMSGNVSFKFLANAVCGDKKTRFFTLNDKRGRA